MLRNRIKDCCSRSLQLNKRCPSRAQSSAAGGGKKSGALGKVAIIATGATAGLLGAGTALAKFDPAFRKSVEDTIPMSNMALDAIIGPSAGAASPAVKPQAPAAAVKPAPPSPSAVPKADQAPPSLLQKKLQREAREKAVAAKPVSPAAALPAVPAPVLEKPAEPATAKATTVKAVEPPAPLVEKTEPVKPSAPAVNPKSGLSPSFGKDAETSHRQEKASLDKEIDLNSLPEGVRDRVKQEMTEQLKLQLSAYNDYLHDQLRLQQDELSRMHAIEAEERVLEEKMRYQRELAASIVRLQEVEQVLQVRERLDKEERELKQVWFLCQQLNDSLKSSPLHGIEKEPLKLLTEAVLPVLERIFRNEDTSPLVRLAVQSIQEKKELRERGVYTEDALIARFDKVSRVCQRVSLIGDEGGSLWRFLLSYTMPSLLFDRVWAIPAEELNDEAVNVRALDTFSIVARVRHHLKNRNLEMSLRYANQLKGEARKAASDWIRDVRNHLEVRQASTLIQAQAAAVALKTFKQ